MAMQDMMLRAFVAYKIWLQQKYAQKYREYKAQRDTFVECEDKLHKRFTCQYFQRITDDDYITRDKSKKDLEKYQSNFLWCEKQYIAINKLRTLHIASLAKVKRQKVRRNLQKILPLIEKWTKGIDFVSGASHHPGGARGH